MTTNLENERRSGALCEPLRLPLPERTLPAMLRRQAEHFGERPLLAIAGARWSHRDAVEQSGRMARALRDAGIAKGDRVALLSGNRVEFLEAFLGCAWLGAVAVPINTAAMGPQIDYGLHDSGATLLVIEASLVARLEALDLAATSLRRIWILGDDRAVNEARQHVETLRRNASRVSVEPYPGPAAAALAAADLSPGDPLTILYTSGTTGPAKGVVCPHAQFYWWGVNTVDVLGIRHDDVLCTTLPLFHVNALNTFVQAMLSGSEAVYAPRFSASGFWASMQAAEATVIYLLGAMVPMLLAQPAGPAERAHRVRIGLGPGVPMAAGAALHERCGVSLLEGFGSTETNFVMATQPDSPRGGVMGWLRPGFQARVADAHDHQLPDGEAGELLLRADEPYAFASGYHGRPEQTLAAWRNLWFHTGDRVVRDADGAYRFIDRLKDAIRRRGENISSYEVEQVLAMHPGVVGVAVFPVRSELAEDEVMAAVVCRDAVRVDPESLAEFCVSRLPRFAIPRYIDIVADLPRTESGKVQKFRLIERGVGAATWQRPDRPAAAQQRSEPT